MSPPPPPPPRRPRPLWLDCDPGHDDALAIVLALHSPDHCRLLGVSTVASNHSLRAVTGNAAAVLAACGGRGSSSSSTSPASTSSSPLSVPLHAGAESPLFLPPKICPEIHGSSGLCVEGGSFADVVRKKLRKAGQKEEELFFPALSRKGAVQAMAEAIEKAAAEIEEEEEGEEGENGEANGGKTKEAKRRKRKRKPQRAALVATGALTNIALLLWTRPDLVAAKKFDLYLMGGALGQGNTGVVAEFNFEVDPHAASAVFGSAGAGRGLRVTLVPLDVTHTALVSPDVLRKLGLEGEGEGEEEREGEGKTSPPLSPLRTALRSLLLYFAETYKNHFGFDVGPPLHDPLAVLAAIFPPEEEEEGQEEEGEEKSETNPVFDLTRARVDAEVSSPLSLGQSVIDLLPALGRSQGRGEPNALVATRVDLGVLWGMLGAAIERADRASPL